MLAMSVVEEKVSAWTFFILVWSAGNEILVATARCDSEIMLNNACSHCLKLGLPCTHTKAQQKRGPKSRIMIGGSQSVDTLVANITGGTPSQAFLIPDSKEEIRKILVKLATRIQELENDRELSEYSELHKSVSLASVQDTNRTQETINVPGDSLDHDDSVEDLSKELANFSFGAPSNTHFGESSNIMLMKTAMDHGKQLTGSILPDWNSIFAHVRRPRFWDTDPWPSWYLLARPELEPAYEFPDTDTLHQFMDLYFRHCEIDFPLLHRPSFENSISEGLHLRDAAFGAVVLAVCAIGAGILSASNIQREAGDRWIAQVRLSTFVFSSKLELYHLQLYCLMIYYLYSVSKGIDSAWLLAGIAIRRAQEKGAHRRYTVSTHLPTVEGELWKRAFWTLIVADVQLSTLFGRPRAISSQDFDLEPLIECDDEYWEPKDGSPAFVQPLGKPSKISYWNAYLKIMEIYGFAWLTIYSVRKADLSNKMGISDIEWYEKAVMETDSALNKWMDSIPQHLRWDSQPQDSVTFAHSTILYSTYYWIQIMVHKHFIPRPRTKDSSGILSFPSLAICTNAARSCLRVCEAYVKINTLYPAQLVLVISNAATVLALNLARSNQLKLKFNMVKEITDIYRCIDLLRLYERTQVKHHFVAHFMKLTLLQLDTCRATDDRTSDSINVILFVNRFPPRLHPSYNEGSPALSASASQSQVKTTQFLFNQFSAASDSSSAPAVTYGTPAESSSTTFRTQLPFYSSELGGLPIHPKLTSLSEPNAEHFDSHSPGFNHHSTQANFDVPSSPSPDMRQYFSLFDDTVGNMCDSFMGTQFTAG
ncbi:hypothetical protein D9758_013200 [Tetrapyrgos nigripes]|uniref:Xylanolytic transcriptional activator regulatory domain-containing protein n=1 Tax=Tetrapyrgos nigripes TaxID=182062 RepID=A0A8H5FS09_9AGAR|nr:hypothetical protein D9758_013200 [Tetrapyrgos nigripes]